MLFDLECACKDIIEITADIQLQVIAVNVNSVVMEVSGRGESSLVEFHLPPSTDTGTRSAGPPDSDSLSEPATHWTLEYLLLGDLIELLEEDYDEENRRWILVVLNGLLDAIQGEGRDARLLGLQELFCHAPGLQMSLTRLELEHEELICQLDRLRNRVVWRLSVLEEVAREIRQDLKDWLSRFQRFSMREARFRRGARRIHSDLPAS